MPTSRTRRFAPGDVVERERVINGKRYCFYLYMPIFLEDGTPYPGTLWVARWEDWAQDWIDVHHWRLLP